MGGRGILCLYVSNMSNFVASALGLFAALPLPPPRPFCDGPTGQNERRGSIHPHRRRKRASEGVGTQEWGGIGGRRLPLMAHRVYDYNLREHPYGFALGK